MRRPKNAAPNTAFSVVSEESARRPRIMRVSLDPGSLDGAPEGEGGSFRSHVVWDYDDGAARRTNLDGSCRSKGKRSMTNLYTAADVGAFLESGKEPDDD